MESIALSVVIPVYNEAENIRPLVERLGSSLRTAPGQIEMLFVDDGSTDQTLTLLKEAQAKDARIRIAHFRHNLGQTAAMAAGFHLARGKLVVTIDGDLQNDPRNAALGGDAGRMGRRLRHPCSPPGYPLETHLVTHRKRLSKLGYRRQHRRYVMHAEGLPA